MALLDGAIGEDIPEACSVCGLGSAVRENARRLAGRVLRAQEEERARVSRELHDETGQMLTLLLVRLRVMASTIADDRLRQDCLELRGLVQEALDGVRRLAVDLGPSVLDDMGLLPAIEWLTDRVRIETGLRIELDVPSAAPQPRRDAALALYRVYQEALTNVVRHAHASHVSVSLRPVGDDLALTIADDGVGFDVKSQRGSTSSVGLIGMGDRMRLVGGTAEITSGRRGTTVVATLPVAT